jgi:uncharacterized protein DUF87
MKILLGDGVELNVQRLIETRMLLQANSGGGKSWALRRILEQTHGHVQQIVIDTEDEFYTLREKHDYILVRHEGGDCVPEVRSAELLATRLLELGVSAIISIYELSPRERREFVKRFLTSLVNAPKKLWHRALIVIDEAHEFCPEQGRGSRDDSGGCAEAVIGLMAKGRKRGFCGLLATQRLSKLNKDAAAEANNKLIGRATIDVDRKRAAEELGFTSKEDILSLRKLSPGEFFAFGPAISDDVIPLKFGGVETTHPKAGAAPTPVAPPKHKVQSVLAQLADLPQEAEQERATIADLQKKIRGLEQERRDTLRNLTTDKATRVETIEKPVLKDSQITRIEKFAERFGLLLAAHENALCDLFGRFASLVTPIGEAIAKIKSPNESQNLPDKAHNDRTVAPSRAPARQSMVTPRQSASGATGAADGAGPTGKLRDIMVALAQKPEGLNARQIGARARVSTKGGSFSTFVSRGRGAGWIEGTPSTLMRITQAGLDALGSFTPLPSGRQLFDHWMQDLGQTKAADIFRVLYEAWPEVLGIEQIGEAAGVSTKGGSFSTFMSRLKSRDLVVGGRGEFKASDELFEES